MSFVPMYVLPQEYTQYGLPSSSDQPEIDNLVQMASLMIDEHCGRTDGDGNGSLVYSTYQQRILMQSPGRNLAEVPIKPLVALTTAQIATLSGLPAASGDHFYTGALPNTIYKADGTLSSLLFASGRYSYTRRDASAQYPDLNTIINPLQLVTMFGGPAPWIALDITNTDYDAKTGNLWIPAGLQLSRYNEIIITYNSGYNPLDMPKQIKMACAALTKNLMASGAGTTGIKSQSLGRAGFSVSLSDDLIDKNIQNLIRAFVVVRTY